MLIGRPALTLLLACAVVSVAAGCGGEPAGEAGEEAHIEGLAETLDGIDYDIFLTRQLNLEDPEDSGYTDLDDPPPGKTYYASFVQVCNRSDEAAVTSDDLYVEDSQGDVFTPIDISSSEYAYQGGATLEPGDCQPEEGSLPQQGPSGGSLVVYEFPIAATENRPLTLHIGGSEKGEELQFTLDL
jgi:hypothetical protein